MTALRRILVAAAASAAAAALISACGGNVIVDPEGSGGSGGAPTTTTTGPTTSTVTPTTSTSTSTGPSGCDSGNPSVENCGDSTSGCIQCALEGACIDEFTMCANSQQCIEYVTCIDPCPDTSCTDSCAMSFPSGAQIYNDLVSCAICQECFIDCDGANAGCF